MKNKIGVMQGRLLPKYKGNYQAHPLGYWKKEFKIARDIGLDNIEFILDFNEADANPLLKRDGVEEIKKVVKKTGVKVQTICADYFMDAPLHSLDIKVAEQSQQVMFRLIDVSALLGVTDIVIPCVEQSSLNNNDALDRFIKQMQPLVRIAEKKYINLSLETDLAPQPFLDLLSRFQSERVTINYDIGNSASLGYNPVEELNAYGSMISDIHIKDRLLGGGPVVLGEGDADFISFFNKLKEFNYKGPFIMQAYRDENGVEIFKKQLNWIGPFLNN